jgi:hypothetical protein
MELSQTQDSKIKQLSKSKSTKFVKDIINEIDLEIDSYLNDFPDDDSIERIWEPIKSKLVSVPQTKKRLQALRKMWRAYKKSGEWKKLIKELANFLIGKDALKKEIVEPFDAKKLRLITIDFIS